MTASISVEFKGVSAVLGYSRASLLSQVLTALNYSDLDERTRVSTGYDINNLSLSMPNTKRISVKGNVKQRNAFNRLLDGRLSSAFGHVYVHKDVFSLSQCIDFMEAKGRLTLRAFATWVLNKHGNLLADSAKDTQEILARADLLPKTYVPVSSLSSVEKAQFGFALMRYSNCHVAIFSEEDMVLGGQLSVELAHEAKIVFGHKNYIMTSAGAHPVWFDPESEIILL